MMAGGSGQGSGTVIGPRFDVYLTREDMRRALLRDAREGLLAPTGERQLSPVWFYDDYGSMLFDRITELPEYYPTRAERRLLEAHSAEIARRSRARVMVELGAGTCTKSRILLDSLTDEGSVQSYVPFDVSESTLREAAAVLARDYPGLLVRGVIGDFHRHIPLVPVGDPTLVAFLGGTIGNLLPRERGRFFDVLAEWLAPGDWFLLGADLVKDPARLLAAYDDSEGVTAAFNRNVLSVLNRELGADFCLDRYDHVVHWDCDEQWIEMRLRSRVSQRVDLPGLGAHLDLEAGEEILTEVSAKFTRQRIDSELCDARFVVEDMWDEPGGEFMMVLARLKG